MAFISTKKTFFKAAETGDLEELKYGLESNQYSINLKDAKGSSALHIAVLNGRLDAVKYLLTRKPDLELMDADGDTALMIAAMKDKSAIGLLLVAAGADVNTHGTGYSYPLHWTAHNGDLDFTRALVDKGAELDVRTRKDERTPTFYAVSADRGAVLELLVSKGARCDIPGTDNKTPLDVAKEKSPRLQKIIEETPREVVTPEPAAAAVVPAPVIAPAQILAPASAAANENTLPPKNIEEWALLNATTVAKASTFGVLNRKLTEIFNFETRERMTISENLKSGAETLGLAEPFSALNADALARAASELEKLGGTLPGKKTGLDAGSPIARLANKS